MLCTLVSMHTWAIIFKPWDDVPVYHRLVAQPRIQTKCGRQLGLHTPMLPKKHVVKFARPCKGCFPS